MKGKTVALIQCIPQLETMIHLLKEGKAALDMETVFLEELFALEGNTVDVTKTVH